MVIKKFLLLGSGPDTQRFEFKVDFWEEEDDGSSHGSISSHDEEDDAKYDREGTDDGYRKESLRISSASGDDTSTESETFHEEDLIESDEEGDIEIQPPLRSDPTAPPPPPNQGQANVTVSRENDYLILLFDTPESASGSSSTIHSSAEGLLRNTTMTPSHFPSVIAIFSMGLLISLADQGSNLTAVGR